MRNSDWVLLRSVDLAPRRNRKRASSLHPSGLASTAATAVLEARLPDDQAAYRREFHGGRGIDLQYADIPVEVMVPRKFKGELAPEMAPARSLRPRGRVLQRIVLQAQKAGLAVPTPVQGHSVPMAVNQTGRHLGRADRLGQDARLHAAHPVQAARGSRASNKADRVRRRAERRVCRDPRACARADARARHADPGDSTNLQQLPYRPQSGARVAYGGTPFGDQMRDLERGCDILVATP